jgi:hypothetical protein
MVLIGFILVRETLRVKITCMCSARETLNVKMDS